jgi:hypothetical protein
MFDCDRSQLPTTDFATYEGVLQIGLLPPRVDGASPGCTWDGDLSGGLGAAASFRHCTRTLRPLRPQRAGYVRLRSTRIGRTVFLTRRAPHALAPSLFRRRHLELIDDMILSRDLCRLHFDGFLFAFVTDRPLQRDHSAARDDLDIVSIR